MRISSDERHVLSVLENIEQRKIEIGDFSFVPVTDLEREVDVDPATFRTVISSLRSKRFLIYDPVTDTLKSRTADITRSLFYTKYISKNREVNDVSDIKYIRYKKLVPKYNITFDSKEVRNKINEILNYSSIEQHFGNVISLSMRSLAQIFPEISNFQFKSTIEILSALNDGNQSVAVVADTGAGKSLAYQFPLFIWILKKKIDAYLSKESVNCSGLLVFPRNVLAQNQHDDMVLLANTIKQSIDRLSIPSDLKQLLTFKIEKDFGGISMNEKVRLYQSHPDIIITNPETLKRRLTDPIAHNVYRDHVDLILYDEIHLYHGLYGANISALNARLQNVLPYNPVFVGMSATIAKPEKHCQKLFALRDRPKLITDKQDILEEKTVEHHVIVKPRAGRSPLGVTIDTTSYLLHNRRDGISQARSLPDNERPKSVCFVDSLDIAGRWNHDLNDYEFSYGKDDIPNKFTRSYPIYYAPWSKDIEIESCEKCKEGEDVLVSCCEYYQNGRCWYFSLDDSNPSAWIRTRDKWMPPDSIISKRLTSQEVNLTRINSVYDLFYTNFNGERIPADNIIATPVLEVGVDFKGIHEIIMYGEIRSPVSYKQKSGRGAREGNISDGLFVMTVIPSMPLANFYYRHFYRLVHPSLSPIPLEPSNPDIIKAHAFASVFDYIAKNDINIFNLLEIKIDETSVETKFEMAREFIQANINDIKDYIQSFLKNFGILSDEIPNRAIQSAIDVLNRFCDCIKVEDEEKKLITWLFQSTRNGMRMRRLENVFEEGYSKFDERLHVMTNLKSRGKELLQALNNCGGDYEEMVNKLERLLEEKGVK